MLECLSVSENSLSLTEISRHVGLSASTTHRLLRALTQAGYVDQDHSTERYGLGIGVAVLGQRAIERAGYQLARPVLAALSERTGESASLGVRRGTEVVVLDRVVGPAPLRFDHPAGAELAVHASAMGKVLLAFSGTSIADEVRTLDVLSRSRPGPSWIEKRWPPSSPMSSPVFTLPSCDRPAGGPGARGRHR